MDLRRGSDMYRPINATDMESRCPVCDGGDIHSFSCARANPPMSTMELEAARRCVDGA